MSRGGIRWGAGRPAQKGKTEHCERIDVRRWYREGPLQPGAAGGWAWWDANGEMQASIGYRTEAAGVALHYAANGKPVTQRVPIERTACNYGGERPWFRCPTCDKRIAVLFLRFGRFACRRCQRVAYTSQSENCLGRSWRKQQKAEAKLGEDWERPAGMHRRTHERLLSAIHECEQVREAALADYLVSANERSRI